MWSRGVSRGWLVSSSCHFSSARAQAEVTGIDDFLHSVATAPPTAHPAKNGQVLEKAAEFCSWLEKNPVKSFEQFKTAAQLAVTVKSAEQGEAFARVDQLAEKVLPGMYKKFGAVETVEALRLLVQMAPKSAACEVIQKFFRDKEIKSSELKDVPFDTLIMIFRYSDSSVDQTVLDVVADALCARIDQELNPIQLLSLLAGTGYDNGKWFHNKKFIEKVEKLVPVMDLEEKIVVLNRMAANRQRNSQILGAIINSICFSSQNLSVNQVVSITSSCASLNYYPTKIAKKVSQDLSKNANVLRKWGDVLGIADSFVRLRMGEQKSWDILVRWAIENEKDASAFEISRFVTGLARLGIPSGKPLAAALKKHLNLTKVKTPTTWLNNVYTLAYFQELDAVRADSVLNKSFIDQVMKGSMEVHDRLRHAMTLLMINASAQIDLKGEYAGPTVSKETFAQYGIHFDAKTIRNARQLKYSSKQMECDDVFLKFLFKLAPQDTHCRMPSVEDCGVFVDAYVMPDQKSGLLVSTNQWGSSKPRPLLFYGWKQTKQNMESTGEDLVFGKEQLGLRLLRAEGFQPVVVMKSEFDYCPADIDKVNMLRDKIHKSQ